MRVLVEIELPDINANVDYYLMECIAPGIRYLRVRQDDDQRGTARDEENQNPVEGAKWY